MADLSHDEKRAAGWRKLKKYQQHKSSSGSSKSTRKKHDTNENNGEAYRLFTGFSEPQNNGGEDSAVSSPPIEHLMKNTVPPDNSNVSEKLSNTNFEEMEKSLVDSSVDTNVSYSTSTVIHSQSGTQESTPVATNIFSNSYSSSTNNFSDFFDNIKSSSNGNVENACLSTSNVLETASSVIEAQNLVESSASENVQVIKNQSGTTVQFPGSTEQLNSVLECRSQLESKVGYPLLLNDGTKENVVTYELGNQEISSDAEHSVVSPNFASSAESLRQLSLELSGLIDESVSTSLPQPRSQEMERRNQELAALLASEQQKCERLQLQMKEYESRVSQLQIEASQHQTEQLARLQRELRTTQEQLQLHVQTVGILVGEKAELEAALSKSQQTAKQKAAEVEELQGRLKASRHRVGDLERELATSNSSNKQLDSSLLQQNKELTRIKLEKEVIAKQLEEAEEEVAELRQNLDVRSTEVQNILKELRAKQSQLDLAQLKVQQLSLSDTTDMEKQLESLHQQKVDLERQLTELQQIVQALGSERDQANAQYQEYLHHVNGQMKSMADKLAAATTENELLSSREQSLVKHLSELEKQLQQLQQQNQRSRLKDSPSHAATMETIQQLQQTICKLGEEKEKLTINLDNQVQESKVIQDQLDMYLSRVEELENMVESLKADQPDSHKLLAVMESDKVAASRAVEQNQKLKEQLQELEEGFIQVSNHKLELTQQLQKEQHLSKELGERLAQQELEISELRTHLTENEKMIESLQKSSSEQLTRQMLKQDQIADQMRHYEAQGHMTETLQNELRESKELCRSLRTENDELCMKLAQVSIPEATEVVEDQRDDLVDSLKASVCQLKMERDQLFSQLQKAKPPLINSGTDVPDNFMKQDVDVEEYCNLKGAMEKLEERFTQTMKEVAELSDEKQRLEHLVLQLQGETETIGEYIALYQMQRSILRQRALEKDEQLARLARDREEVKIKLNELNRLINQLVAENGKTPAPVSVPTSVPDMNGVTEEQLSGPEGMVNGDLGMKEQVEQQQITEARVFKQEAKEAKTADKIIALLSEIETSTLVEPKNVENFHPCPWCSGRLITV